MSPLTHLILGLIFSLIFSLIFQITFLDFLILFLSTWFFIDLDLVFLFVLEEKSVNPVKFLKWEKSRKNFILSLKKEERKKYVYPFRFFHSIEFLSLVFLISFLNNFFLYVFVGFIFHLVLDWIDLYQLKLDIFHKVSWFYYLKKNKKHKKH